jgi:phthalate 4,5-cis-dihydrodiol dehydrogenase
MLRVGILGAGYFGAFHARAIAATPGVELAAVCDEQLSLAKALSAEHGGTPSADWRQLLDDKSIDTVVIATPHHFHRDMAVAAAKAGKHILLEKPMGRTAAECTEVIAAAERSGIKLMVGQLLHFALPSLVARRILESGELGKPVTGSATLSKLWIEPNRRAWHLDPVTGGGMLMTAGIHPLDLLIWMMGEPAQAVSAVVGTHFHEQAADDSALLTLRFPGGRFGQVASIGYRDGAVTYGMELVCERGTLRIDFDRGVSVGKGGRWTDIAGSSEPEWMLRAVEREWQAMAGAVEGKILVPVTGAYGCHIIACIEAAFVSSRERREVAIEP